MRGTIPRASVVFYDRHAGAVLAFCVRRTGCAETAADLTAEMFAAAYARRRLPTATRERPQRRGCSGSLGARSAHFFVDGGCRIGIVAGSASGPSNSRRTRASVSFTASRWSRMRLALIEALSWNCRHHRRHALRLRIVDELPYVDIAARLGCSEGAARVRVSRGLTKLAGLLEAP